MLYLPDEVDLARLSIHPLTDGCKILNDQAGIPITLPGTVEEHYLGEGSAACGEARPEEVISLNSDEPVQSFSEARCIAGYLDK